MSRALFEVVPAGKEWIIRMPGDSVSERRPTKGDAIRRARQLGRRYDTWRIRVQKKGGALETELASAEAPPTS